MKRKLFILCGLLATVLLLSPCLASCQGEPDGADRETVPEESYETVTDAGLTHRGGLSALDYDASSPVGEWLTACASSDRDEQFDAYTLRREITDGENTTFTYMIYYPHGGEGLTVTPELLEGESGGYVLNLTYTAGCSGEYCLDYLSVTLPTDKAPRVRLLYDGEVLGQMATVTEEEIG